VTTRWAALSFTLAALLAATHALAADGGKDAGAEPSRPDAGIADPDQEIIEHLDELQYLELLQNLELFDPKGEEK
jgi:hypothetical protein